MIIVTFINLGIFCAQTEQHYDLSRTNHPQIVFYLSSTLFPIEETVPHTFYILHLHDNDSHL